MSSAFALLTAGGARFDKDRFKHDHALFAKTSSSKTIKGKGKQKAASPLQSTSALPSTLNIFHDPSSSAGGAARPGAHVTEYEESESESEDEDANGAASSAPADQPAPPKQKITLTGPDPLPASLTPALSSLFTHSAEATASASASTASASRVHLISALENAGVSSLWGVQCAVAGCLLSGVDVMCVAPTGSGKTLAYVLPTLVALRDPARVLRRESRARAEEEGGSGKEEGRGVRAVVLVPTHDLAVQIYGVVQAVTDGRKWRTIVLSRSTERAVCESSPGSAGAAVRTEDVAEGVEEEVGEDEGDSQDEDASSSDHALGIDILIATPERLHRLVSEKRISLKSTRHLILDESDRLLSSDFLPQIAPIVRAAKGAQKCLLSATMPAGSEAVAREWMKDPVRVVVGLKDSAVTTVSQSLLFTSSEPGKLLALRNLISAGDLPYPSLIFVQSIERAEALYRQLVLEVDGLRAGVVHGGRSNAQRDEAVRGFREGKVWVLVVTEVMARGMDFGGVKVVVNYDFPQTVQSYVHRIGRTGRAGRQGKAITFFGKEDAPYLRTIANVLKQSNCPVPQWMLDLPAPSKNTKRNLARAPVKRKKVGGGGRDLALEERKRKGAMVRGSKRKRDMDGAEKGAEKGSGD